MILYLTFNGSIHGSSVFTDLTDWTLLRISGVSGSVARGLSRRATEFAACWLLRKKAELPIFWFSYI